MEKYRKLKAYKFLLDNPSYLTGYSVSILVVALLIVLVLFIAAERSYSLELNENDYIINNFGINDTNPFISVKGIAGSSYDPSMGDEGYTAYVFDTDKGIYQISVFYTSSGNIPSYSSSRILSNVTNVGDCLITEKTNAMPHFKNQTVEYVDSNIQFTKVNRALAILVTLDDPDQECSSGEHVRKIISVATKPTLLQN